jgi:hypothetical protein
MKKVILLMLLPIIGHSQYDYALKLHNNAREIYPNYSIDYDRMDENNYGEVSFLTYSEKLSEEAQKRADILAEEFFKWYDSDHNENFWFTEIAIGSDGSKVFLSDREYVTNAVLNWTQLEFDYQKYLDGEEVCYDSKDISDFLHVVWGTITEVGFGISRSEEHVFVVASYGYNTSNYQDLKP